MSKIKVQLTVYLKGGQLRPISAYDAEKFSEFKDGQQFNMTPISERSNPHHRLYWITLSKVVKATGKWPSVEHLHRDLKMACGYYQTAISKFTGGVIYIADSTSFSTMSQQEFNSYFETTMAKLSETIGFDPLE